MSLRTINLDIICPACNIKKKIKLDDIAKNKNVKCTCGCTIKLNDKNKKTNKTLKEFDKTIKSLNRVIKLS